MNKPSRFILISQQEANEKYAKLINKPIDEFGYVDCQQAYLNHVLEVAAAKKEKSKDE